METQAFPFLDDACLFGRSDINQHKFLTALIWQNTAHQRKADRLIPEFQPDTAQIMFELLKPLDRSKLLKKEWLLKKKGI